MKHVVVGTLAGTPASPAIVLETLGWKLLSASKVEGHKQRELSRRPLPHRFPRIQYALWNTLQRCRGLISGVGGTAFFLSIVWCAICYATSTSLLGPFLGVACGTCLMVAADYIPLSKIIYFGPAEWKTRRVLPHGTDWWAPPAVRDIGERALRLNPGSWLELHELWQDQRLLDPVLEIVNGHGRAALVIYDFNRVYAIAEPAA